MRPIVGIEQSDDVTSRERVQRPGIEILVARVPPKRPVDRDRVAGSRASAHIEQQLAEAGKFPIWKIGQILSKASAVDCEDAKVERLKSARRDDDRRCERPRPREFQIDISFTCGPVINRGSVISCTSAAVTPGASSINFSPLPVTSITQ